MKKLNLLFLFHTWFVSSQIISLAFIFSVVTPIVGYTQIVSKHGKLQVDGTKLKDEHGNAIVLRGMSFGWHNWWSQYYNKNAVKWLRKDWNCHIVRAAMGIEPEGAYLTKPEWSKKCITEVIDAAIKEDIYVIIDWHSHGIQLAEAKLFFAEMAQKYGKEPHIIYEIFNEPDYETWDEVKAYSIELIKTIRQYDPDNIILIGSPHWDQDIDIVADSPIVGYNNLMYTLHFYAATHKQELRNKADYAIGKNIPIFISESAGMEATGDGALNEDEWQKWIDWAEQNKISWITWSVSSKNETCSVLKANASPKGNWKEENLKESGIKTRKLLKKYNK